jgi:hypothetical protein
LAVEMMDSAVSDGRGAKAEAGDVVVIKNWRTDGENDVLARVGAAVHIEDVVEQVGDEVGRQNPMRDR